jgi:hypothetical protein
MALADPMDNGVPMGGALPLILAAMFRNRVILPLEFLSALAGNGALVGRV